MWIRAQDGKYININLCSKLWVMEEFVWATVDGKPMILHQADSETNARLWLAQIVR